MVSTKLASIGLFASLACTYFAAPAQAQSPRTFVSAAGNDSNPCTFAAPCRHFQAAVNATSLGGEVDALDPAGYSPIVISRAITIEGQGWSYIAPPAGGNAITINAVSGNVTIRGVSLNGAGITGNTTGIQFNSGGSLNVRDSVIRNFSGDGIDFEPSAGGDLWVSSTMVSDNGNTGIAVFPSGTAQHQVTINRAEITNNPNYGVFLWGTPSNGGIHATISESVVSGNGAVTVIGIYALTDAGHSPVVLTVFHSVTSNSGTGIFAEGAGAIITVANSTSTGNAIAWQTGFAATGIVQSYGDNYFVGNAFDASNFPPPLVSRQ